MVVVPGGGEDSSSAERVVGVAQALQSAGIAADVAVNGFTGGFNATVTVRNTGTVATSTWQVDLSLNNVTAISSLYGAVLSGSGSTKTFTAVDYTSVIQPGASATFGFNATSSSSGSAAVVAVRRDGANGGTGGTTGSGGTTSTGGTPAGGTANKGGSTTAAGGAVGTGATANGGSSNPGIALDKTASASSFLGAFPASYGNDSSLNTKWCASTSATNEWWQVDLGAIYNLTGSEVTWENAGRSYQYVLTVSNDNQSFSTANNQSANLRTTQIQDDTFSAQGRYVRITVTGLATNPVTSACFYDLKLFGSIASTSGSGGASGTGLGGASSSYSTAGGAGGTASSTGGATAIGGSGGGSTSGNGASTASGGTAGSSATTSTSASGGTTIGVDRRKFFIRLPGGVRRQDVAVGTNGGPLFINDGVSVVRPDGNFSSVAGTNVADGSRIGVGAQVQSAWVDGNVTLTNRTWVHGVAKATGSIAKDVDTTVTGGSFEKFKFTTPEVISWDVDFPVSPADSVWLQPAQPASPPQGGYDVAYVPRAAKLHLSTGFYTFNRMTIEDQGILEIDNSGGPVFIYVRDAFTFRGQVVRAQAKGNVLFGVAGVSTVFIERPFIGVVVAPWAPISVTSAPEHRGSFFGNGVTIHQQSKLVHEPLDPTLFCASGSACSSFCPCGGDTCGESACGTGMACAENMGPRFGRAAGLNVCWSESCNWGGAACGSPSEACGYCGDPERTCQGDADCPAGDVCGQANGAKFGLSSTANVCWSASCVLAPNTPPNCGDKTAACGYCDCSDACKTKKCGDDPSDGCGGVCTGICQNGQGGCTQGSDCLPGSVCGFGIGARFGLANDVNVCWPVSCELQDPALSNGGVSSYSCGVAPSCVPKCESGSSAPDGCGGYCGQCKSGEVRTPTGLCGLALGDVWDPSPTYATASLSLSAGAPSDETLATSVSALVAGQPTTSQVNVSASTSTAGALTGSFAVSDRGEATYSIPITVPPGRLGIQPSLSLSYVSNKLNGMLGMGWALSGLSTITRCPWIVGREGVARPVAFDYNDDFCLDGNALIQTGFNSEGTTFRTESETFSKIVAHSSPQHPGPDYFVVYTKSGQIMKYGGGGSSTISTSTGVPRVWALRSVADRYGNEMTIRYQEQRIVGAQLRGVDDGSTDLTGKQVDSVGELVPDVIAYGGNGDQAQNLAHSRFVAFTYDTSRNDPVMHYQWGVKGYSKKRLVKIDTYAGSKRVRTYHLRYDNPGPGGTSLVSSVQECGVKWEQEQCTPPTVFEYESPASTAMGEFTPFSGASMDVNYLDLIYQTWGEVSVLDVNGDGADDVLSVSNPTHTCDLWLGSGVANGGVERITADATSPMCKLLWSTSSRTRLPIDINHDGRIDIGGHRGTHGEMTYLLSTGRLNNGLDGLFTGQLASPSQNVIAGDFDGNGFTDILSCDPASYKYRDQCTKFHSNLNSGQAFYEGTDITVDGFASAEDFDGDGADELVRRQVFSSGGQGMLDMNGDGHLDRLDSSGLSFGNGRDSSFGGTGSAAVSGYAEGGGLATDLDGDGLAEYVLLNRGAVFKWDPAHQIVNYQETGEQHWDLKVKATGDINGDGVNDAIVTSILPIPGDKYGRKVVHGYSLAPDNRRAGFLKQVTDGFGKRTSVKYESGTYLGPSEMGGWWDMTYNVGNCFSDKRKTSQCQRKIGPVVSAYQEDQVAGALVNPGPVIKLKYEAARKGTLGRNWFAFEKRTITGPLSSTTIEYYTDPPSSEYPGQENSYFMKVGKVAKVTTTSTVGTPGSSFGAGIASRTTVATSNYDFGSQKQFYFESNSSTRTLEDNTEIARTDITKAVDEYGNVRTIDTTTSSGGLTAKTIHVERTIENDPANWILGKVRWETVSATANGVTNSRSTGYVYDSAGRVRIIARSPDGRVGQNGIPGASNPYLSTTLSRNAFGNVFKVESSDQDERDTASVRVLNEVLMWDEAQIFPIFTRNAMGHETTWQYAAAFGMPVRVIDANDASSTRTYDPLGRLVSSTTPSGSMAVAYQFDSPTFAEVGQVIPTWNALKVVSTVVGGGASSTGIDAFGRVVQRIEPGFGNTNVERAYEYDANGRLVRESLPHGVSGFSLGAEHDPTQGFLQYTYAGAQRIATTLPDGNVVRNYHVNRNTASGPVASLIGSTGAVSGQVTVNPALNIQVALTDALGNSVLTAEGSADGNDLSIARYAFGPFGVPLSVTGPKGTTTIQSDVWGRPEVLNDPATGTSVTYYNGFGEVVYQQDGKGEVTLTDHDALGRTTEIRSDRGDLHAKWAYDGANAGEIGKLIAAYRQSKPGDTSGNWTRYQYTSQGLLKATEYRIVSSPDNYASGESFTFNYRRENANIPGRVTGMDYPSSGSEAFGINLGYTASGQLSEITSTQNPNLTYWWLLGMDQGFRPSEERLGDGTFTFTNYYSLNGSGVAGCGGNGVTSCMPGQIKSIQVQKGTNSDSEQLFNESYSYDGNGNLKLSTRHVAGADYSDGYAYDSHDRLQTWWEGITAPIAQATQHDYSYDIAGNLLKNDAIQDYSYDSQHPFWLVSAGGTTHERDDAGNLARRSGAAVPLGVQRFEYNDFNMPYRITNGIDSDADRRIIELEYDASGARLVKRTNSVFGREERMISLTLDIGELYQQQREYDKNTGFGAPTSIAHHYRVFAGGKQIAEIVKPEVNGAIDHENVTTRYLHQDRLGTPVVATNSDGTVAYKQKFAPFGAALPNSGTWDFSSANSGFTGQQHDEDLGLVNMRGRLYDARLGRFTKADPFVANPLDPQGLNRYAYVSNNPLNFTDPSGFDACAPTDGVYYCSNTDVVSASSLAAQEAQARGMAEAQQAQAAAAADRATAYSGADQADRWAAYGRQLDATNSQASQEAAEMARQAAQASAQAGESLGQQLAQAGAAQSKYVSDHQQWAMGDQWSTKVTFSDRMTAPSLDSSRGIDPAPMMMAPAYDLSWPMPGNWDWAGKGALGWEFLKNGLLGLGAGLESWELGLALLASKIVPGDSVQSDERSGNPSQDRKLSNGEIRQLEKLGHHPHDLKPKADGSKYDLFKRPDGEIVVKPKNGSGPGDPTGINIKEFFR